MGSGNEVRLETIHHEGYDPTLTAVFVPAITVHSGRVVYLSGVTAAPSYHDHPHRPEVFDAIPLDIGGQATLLFEHLNLALDAAGCRRQDVVSFTRFFTKVREDQDAVNRIQLDWLGGHLPTSTTVEVRELATDSRLRLEIQTVAIAPA